MIQSLIWLLCYNIPCSCLSNSCCCFSWSVFFCIYILVSCGLCFWIYVLRFLYLHEDQVDANVELVVLSVNLVFVDWHRMIWSLPLSNSSTIFQFHFHSKQAKFQGMMVYLPMFSKKCLMKYLYAEKYSQHFFGKGSLPRQAKNSSGNTNLQKRKRHSS